MGVTVRDGKLDYDLSDNAELSDSVKSLAKAAVIGTGGAALVTAVTSSSTAAIAAGGGVVTAGLAVDAINEADKQDRVDVIDHYAPEESSSYRAHSGSYASSGNSQRETLIQGVHDLFEAGLVSVEEVAGPGPSSPELHGCVSSKAARKNSQIYR